MIFWYLLFFYCLQKDVLLKKMFHQLPSTNNTFLERSRYVTFALVAKFLDDNKPKTSLKKWIRTVSNFIDLQFHLLIVERGESESIIS